MSPPLPPAAPARRPRQLTLLGSFLASSLSACAACLFTNPMEVIKTRLQLDGEGAAASAAAAARAPRQYSGIADALRKIAAQEGVRGLQAGLAGALAYQVAMNGVRLGLYEPVQRALVRATGADPASVLLKATAAACSGALGATLGSPLYMIKSRLQAQSPYFAVQEAHHYAGLLDGLRKVHASEGVSGLFRGLNGALPRVMTGSAVQLSSYDACKALVVQWGAPAGAPQHLAASLLASVLTVTAMNPWDVISTRLYQSVGNRTVYSGPLDCAAQTVAREGWGALQKGWLAQYGRLGPHTVLTFVLLENVRPRVLGVRALTEEA